MKYLFLIIPNRSGSTYIKNILSQKCIPLPEEGWHLGHGCVPEYAPHLTAQLKNIAMDRSLYNWKEIKERWHKRLMENPDCDTDSIFIIHDPPSVWNMPMLEEEFENSYFLLSVRNPYAVAASIYRMSKKWKYLDQVYPIEVCAEQAGMVLEKQMENMLSSMTDNNKVFWRYEDFCASPEECGKMLERTIPELEGIDLSIKAKGQQCVADGSLLFNKAKKPQNFNQESIETLTDEEFDIVTSVLKNYSRAMEFFDYELAEQPTAVH